jgi:hypothetical protein
MLIANNPCRRTILVPALTSLLFVSLIGCSSTPKPVAEVSAAQTALTAAESDESTQYAPIYMDRARQKMKHAKAAMDKENYDQARRLAEEAQADAELAQAISARTQAEKAVSELETSIKVLREEIMRARSKR